MEQTSWLKGIKWRNLFGEIALIFVAINLSIWFNNWNNHRQASRQLRDALTHVREEVTNNLDELKITRQANNRLVNAYLAYRPYFGGSSDTLHIPTPILDSLVGLYPTFYKITDSIRSPMGEWAYLGEVYIEMELPELNEIAWHTTRSLNLGKALSYDCLYLLESTYNKQERAVAQINRAFAALQQGDAQQMIRDLQIAEQLNGQLMLAYEEVLNNLGSCE